MGFSCETLVVPNLPPGRDTLAYLTSPPSSRNQEEVQAQARALGIAKLHGVPSSDIESGFFSAAEITAKPLTLEEKQAIQNSKTCFLPSKLAPENLGKLGEAPFSFPALKQRSNAYQPVSVRHVIKPVRETSALAPQQAPVLRPTTEEMRDFTAFLESNASLLNTHGMLRVLPPDNEQIPLPVGTTDNLAFKTETQVYIAHSNLAEFTYANLRKGFYKALARFLKSDFVSKKPSKWPVVEGKPLDMFRFFRIVEQRRGPDTILKRKEWVQLTREMGFVRGQSTSLSLRTAYSKYLEPFRHWLGEQLSNIQYEQIIPLDIAPVRPGWKELGLGIIYYSGSSRNLQVVCTQPSLRSVPPYTLRQFRYKWTRPQISAQQAEDEFLNLPECYETEHTSQSPVSLRMLPTKSLASNYDISAFPFTKTVAAYCKDSVNSLNVFPELDAGARFASTRITPSKTNAFRVFLVVDGCGRTFYSKNTWTDQYPGEFVVLKPETEAVAFCHGYSASLKVDVAPFKAWMQTYACSINENVQFQPETQICAERCVYEACMNARALSHDQRASVIPVLANLKTRDVALITELKSFASNHALKLAVKINTQTRVCNGLKRFFLCVQVTSKSSLNSRAKFYTVTEFLNYAPKKGDKVQIYSQYPDLDAEQYFDKLTEEVNNAPTVEEAVIHWLKSVSDALTRKQLISESEVAELCRTMPPTPKCECIATKLMQMREKTAEFLKNPAKLELFQAVECADDGGVLERIYASKNRENDEFSAEVKILEQKYLSKELKPEDLESFFRKHGDVAQFQQFWRHTDATETWLNDFVKASETAAVQDRGVAYLNLQDQARQLGLPENCDAMREIAGFFETQKTSVLNSMMFLYTPQMGDSAALIRLQSVIQNSYVEDASTRAVLAELFAAYPILFRLSDSSLVKRPRRSEIARLARYPLIEAACADLDAWLVQAKQLDWEAISVQVNHMVWGRALPVLPKPVSVSAIRNIYIALFALRVVPDDVESVEAMFKNTLVGVDSVALELRAHYGFLL